jgi:hypothetical protein
MIRSARRSALVAALALALPARAQQVVPSGPAVSPTGEDVVYLKDGGMLRGTILEILPNDHVTLQLANGQTAMVQWAYLARIEQRGRPPSASASPTPAAKRTAFVHIESDRPVRLEAVEGKKSFRFVCASPCDIPVDLDQTYRIAGDGVRASGDMQINGQPGQRVLIEVDTSSKAAFVGGIVIVSIAPVVALVGLIVYLVSAADLPPSPAGQSIGGALGIGGLVGIAVGIVMIATNGSSKATQSPVAPGPPRAAAAADAWRLPELSTAAGWTDPLELRRAPAVAIPLLRF